MATTLEIITGLNQAAANAYDGAHDARFVVGDTKEIWPKPRRGVSYC